MNIQFSINPHVFIHHLASQHLRYRDVAALCFWFPRTWHFPLGTFCSFNCDGYQYETKPQTNGGRGYAELLFFPTAEGYVKALYKDDPSDHAPAAYQYVYIYKDHLGNNRISYTLDPETNQIKILEENHYYPFGLKHGNYNAIRKDVKYKEQAASKKEVKQVMPEAVKFKYLYNGKELQDELGLDVTAMDYRQYHPDIGRFMNIDALASFVPSMTPYRFGYDNPIYWSDPFGLIEESVLMDMFNRSGNGETLWENDESLQGFTTDNGGFVGYTSNDMAMNQSPGSTTQLQGVTVKYKNDKDYGRAAFKIQQQVYNTRWYRDFIINEQGNIEYWDASPKRYASSLISETRFKLKGEEIKSFMSSNEAFYDKISLKASVTSLALGSLSVKKSPLSLPAGVGSILTGLEGIRYGFIARDYEKLKDELGIQEIWVIRRIEMTFMAGLAPARSDVLYFYIPHGELFATIQVY